MDGSSSAFPKLGMNGYGDSFPVGEMHNGETAWVEHRGGLTKRELFAAMAMQGMLSVFDPNSLPHTWEGHPGSLASIAVKCADALIAEFKGKE